MQAQSNKEHSQLYVLQPHFRDERWKHAQILLLFSSRTKTENQVSCAPGESSFLWAIPGQPPLSSGWNGVQGGIIPLTRAAR